MRNIESLSLQEAKATVEAVLQEAATQPGQPVAIAVVDSRGDLISYARMDGANQFNQLMATRKAATAVQIGIDTSLLGQSLPALNMSITDFGSTELTVVPGGICIRAPGTHSVIGGIGVSGRLAQEDEALARKGLDALKDLRKP